MVNSGKVIGYVGTYTNGESEGIYSFTLDKLAKKITKVKVAAKIDNPTYLTISNDHQYLYSVAKAADRGGVIAYSITGDGELQEINRQVANGAPPCHVSVDKKNRYLVSANYHKGTLDSYALNLNNGEINSSPSIAQHEGSGPDRRQEKAHTHYAGFTPDEKYILAIDLGIDKLITYKLSLDGKLDEVTSLAVRPGSGPRHLVFHPNGNIAYLMTEFSSEVLVLQYDAENGSFTEIQTISTLPDQFKENNQGSAIQLSSDGRFLYAGNRGHNSIALFSVNQNTWQLDFIEHIPTEGNWPRDFVLDPSETFLVAANQESSNLVLFSRDVTNGRLALEQVDITIANPVCIKFS